MGKLRGLLLASTLFLAACHSPSAEDPFAAFVTGWHDGDLGKVALLTPQGQPLDADGAKRLLAAAEGDLGARRPTLTRHGKPAFDHADATQSVGVSWQLPDGRTWAYDTTVSARKLDGSWKVYLGESTIHPQLQSGQRLTLQATPPKRGTVLAADGTPVVSDVPVVYIGVEPQHVPDVDALVKRLGLVFQSVHVDVDVQGLPARIKAAKPDAFVDVVTLRRADFDQIARDLDDTPGVRTNTGTLSLPLTRTFARALLGTSGPATKELIDASGGALKAGDIAGLSGLQKRYDTLLRGRPGVSIGGGGDPLTTLPAVPGGAVTTTLDIPLQKAADAAVAGSANPSAVVAIRISDGAVLAVANGPSAAAYDTALLAEVPGPAWPSGDLGLGAPWSIGADVFAGRPATDGVVAAPIGYAAAAAALARGHWQQPVLVKDPSPGAAPSAGPPVTGTLPTPPGLVVGVRGGVAYCAYGVPADGFVQALPQ